MTKIVLNTQGDTKKVSLELEDIKIKSIEKILNKAKEVVKVKVRLEQKGLRRIETTRHIPLEGSQPKELKPYEDVRVKLISLSPEKVKEKKLKEGMIIKGESIRRICAKDPQWDGQRMSSCGFYIQTEIVSNKEIENGDILKDGEKNHFVIATERDLYMKINERVIKNIRVTVNEHILVSKK